ncbi:FAD-dependent oxidoreductase, partial [Pseudomonas aeruginosa]|uniref:FAD-dependent oxidoreductase n=1 Tax=Pseudomonas aeruginosa TaxID=287 RepID=UPI003F19422B
MPGIDRRSATPGLPDRLPIRHARGDPGMSADYDLLIVGAGPAGLAAALAAAPSGARIALVDDNPAAGGQIWR